MNRLLKIIKESLASVSHSRFYETERGFQAEFIAELKKRIPLLQLEGAIVEQEYQKRIRAHGINIRPDIIIHVPFEERHHDSRRQGNFVVFELKLNADKKKALSAYENLSKICEVLEYPLGVFINSNNISTHLNRYHGPHKESLCAFAVRLHDDRVEVKHDYPI